MNKQVDKKTNQLGVHPSTASAQLVKDTLWGLIVETGKSTCYRCNKPMCRATFSIEHIEPWLDSAKPKELFFDQRNITFSHLKCNVGAARKYRKYDDLSAKLEATRKKDRDRKKAAYTTEGRRQKKRLTGH